MKLTRHSLFVGYVVLMLAVFLAPVPVLAMSLPGESDKIVHFGIFLGFAFLLHLDRRPAFWVTLLLSLAFAGAIELAQSLLPYRSGDWLDFAAGAAGAVSGIALSLVSQRVALFSGLLLVAVAGRPTTADAQGSPYIPIDDPRLARFELLIDRGAIADPSPLVRPFTEAQAVAALKALHRRASAADSAEARSLLQLWTPLDTIYWGRVDAGLGAQSYTHARRDPLHPAGPSGTRPFWDIEFVGLFGPVVTHADLYGENRLHDDPDFPTNVGGTWTASKQAYRYPVAYISAQWQVASLFLGQISREWGPRGVPGIPLSSWGYPFHQAAFNVGSRDIRLQGVVAQLEDLTDQSGQRIHRYHVAQRLGVQVTPAVHLALWQTAILAGVDRSLNARWITPVAVLFLGNTLSTGDEGNLMFGGDGRIALGNGMSLEGQVAIDDWLFVKSHGSSLGQPNRWALTGSVMGPIFSRGSWRALYTQVSTYAFRTFRPEEDYVNVGVGLGRQFVDGDQFTVTTSWPLRHAWTVTPEATLMRQGEATITDPFPDIWGKTRFPEWHSGHHRSAGARARGQEGHLRVLGSLGVNRTWNADHVVGRTRHHRGGAAGSDAANWPARGVAVAGVVNSRCAQEAEAGLPVAVLAGAGGLVYAYCTMTTAEPSPDRRRLHFIGKLAS